MFNESNLNKHIYLKLIIQKLYIIDTYNIYHI